MQGNKTAMFCFVSWRFREKRETHHLVVFLTYQRACMCFPPTVFVSACLCCVKGCVWQRRSEGLLMMWINKESGINMREVEVIESGKRNSFDLQGESGRLFVFLSKSLHNLHGCWQLYTAWKGLCLYLSMQWGMFSIGSVVNLCSVNSLARSSHNHDRALISVPIFNSLGKADFLWQRVYELEWVKSTTFILSVPFIYFNLARSCESRCL